MEQECGGRSWKRLNFCGRGSTLKKEAGSGSKLGSKGLARGGPKRPASPQSKCCFKFLG